MISEGSAPLSNVPPTKEACGAVIVAFHPDTDFDVRVAAIATQVSAVIVVRNDGASQSHSHFALASPVYELVNSSNFGLSHALNQGVAKAKELGMEWVLLMDQDTVVLPLLLNSLQTAYAISATTLRVGMLVPNYRNPEGGRVAYDSIRQPTPIDAAVTSGSLLSLAAYSVAGPFNDGFFIEGIDTEYCLRLKAFGYVIIAAPEISMLHGAGASTPRNFFGRTVLVSHQRPWRYYMQYRNAAWILGRYFQTDSSACLGLITGLAKRLILITCFEKQRRSKLGLALLGILHGSFGRLGPPSRTFIDAHS